MKSKLVAAGIVFFSLLSPVKAWAASFSQIFAFGDSLADTGNFFQLTQEAIGVGIPPSPPYFNGRFSNGPIWVDYLSSELGLEQTSFALGGATTGTTNTVISGLPGLQQQIQAFTTNNPNADSEALYLIWAGANDYLGAGALDPTQPVNNLANAVTSLAAVGAEDILVVNLPDLGKLPGTNDDVAVATGLNTLTAVHNTALSATLATLNQQPGLNIISLEVNSLFNRIKTNPGEFGFTNVTDACLNLDAGTVCANPDEFFFWDALHPTTRVHRLISEAALTTIRATSVPEASSVLTFLAFGTLGVIGVLQRQHRLWIKQK